MGAKDWARAIGQAMQVGAGTYYTLRQAQAQEEREEERLTLEQRATKVQEDAQKAIAAHQEAMARVAQGQLDTEVLRLRLDGLKAVHQFGVDIARLNFEMTQGDRQYELSKRSAAVAERGAASEEARVEIAQGELELKRETSSIEYARKLAGVRLQMDVMQSTAAHIDAAELVIAKNLSEEVINAVKTSEEYASATAEEKMKMLDREVKKASETFLTAGMGERLRGMSAMTGVDVAIPFNEPQATPEQVKGNADDSSLEAAAQRLARVPMYQQASLINKMIVEGTVSKEDAQKLKLMTLTLYRLPPSVGGSGRVSLRESIGMR